MPTERSYRGRTKVSPWNFGKTSGQTPQQATNITIARKSAEQPFDIAAEQRRNESEVKVNLMKKAGEDAYKLSQSYKFLEQLESDYKDGTKNISPQSGIGGGLSSLKEYGSGVLLRGNNPLRNYVRNREASGVAVGKFSGDTGNFAWQEQLSHLKRLPYGSPNLKPENLGMPDDPEFGISQINNIKSIYANKMLEALEVAKTGVIPQGSGYESWISQQNSAVNKSPIPGMNNQVNKQPFSSQSYQLGQILNVGGKKFTVVGVDDPNDPDLEEIL